MSSWLAKSSAPSKICMCRPGTGAIATTLSDRIRLCATNRQFQKLGRPQIKGAWKRGKHLFAYHVSMPPNTALRKLNRSPRCTDSLLAQKIRSATHRRHQPVRIRNFPDDQREAIGERPHFYSTQAVWQPLHPPPGNKNGHNLPSCSTRLGTLAPYLIASFLANVGCATDGPLMNSFGRLPQGEEVMDGLRAAIPGIVIVDQDQTTYHNTVPESFQTDHCR